MHTSSTSPTYICDVVVFHKTRIAENDLVFDMVADSGEIVRAVAKSARKPGNTFSNRLDLFNVAHICVAKTKSIDIIREAIMIEHFDNLRADINSFAGASAISELLWRLTFDGEANPHMFDFLSKTFQLINDNPEMSKILTIAGCFKLLTMEGFKPQLNCCAECGKKVDLSRERILFSPYEGGVICNKCEGSNDNIELSSKTASLISFLINSTYEEILQDEESIGKRVYEMAKVLKKWTQHHINCSLKSLYVALH